jgi:hypothetical protein
MAVTEIILNNVPAHVIRTLTNLVAFTAPSHAEIHCTAHVPPRHVPLPPFRTTGIPTFDSARQGKSIKLRSPLKSKVRFTKQLTKQTTSPLLIDRIRI